MKKQIEQLLFRSLNSFVTNGFDAGVDPQLLADVITGKKKIEEIPFGDALKLHNLYMEEKIAILIRKQFKINRNGRPNDYEINTLDAYMEIDIYSDFKRFLRRHLGNPSEYALGKMLENKESFEKLKNEKLAGTPMEHFPYEKIKQPYVFAQTKAYSNKIFYQFIEDFQTEHDLIAFINDVLFEFDLMLPMDLDDEEWDIPAYEVADIINKEPKAYPIDEPKMKEITDIIEATLQSSEDLKDFIKIKAYPDVKTCLIENFPEHKVDEFRTLKPVEYLTTEEDFEHLADHFLCYSLSSIPYEEINRPFIYGILTGEDYEDVNTYLEFVDNINSKEDVINFVQEATEYFLEAKEEVDRYLKW